MNSKALDSFNTDHNLHNHIDLRLKPWTVEYSLFIKISDHVTTHLKEQKQITLYENESIKKKMFGSIGLVSQSVYQPISLSCTVSGLQQMISNELGASDPFQWASLHSTGSNKTISRSKS